MVSSLEVGRRDGPAGKRRLSILGALSCPGNTQCGDGHRRPPASATACRCFK